MVIAPAFSTAFPAPEADRETTNNARPPPTPKPNIRPMNGLLALSEHPGGVVAEPQCAVDPGEHVVVQVPVHERHVALEVPERDIGEVPRAEADEREPDVIHRPPLADDLDQGPREPAAWSRLRAPGRLRLTEPGRKRLSPANPG